MSDNPALCVAVCRRIHRTAIAVVGRDGIYDLHRFESRGPDAERILDRARGLATAYNAAAVVVEPGLLPTDESASPPVIATLALPVAKQRLCGDSAKSHRELVAALIERRPELQRLTAGLHFEGPQANDHRWRTVPLLAIALGLAFLHS